MPGLLFVILVFALPAMPLAAGLYCIYMAIRIKRGKPVSAKWEKYQWGYTLVNGVSLILLAGLWMSHFLGIVASDLLLIAFILCLILTLMLHIGGKYK